MNKITKKFELTKKQIIACNNVENAIKEARRLGLEFFGKQQCLTAYRKEVLPYCTLEKNTDREGNYLEEAPCYSMPILFDSGADDTEKIDTDLLGLK